MRKMLALMLVLAALMTATAGGAAGAAVDHPADAAAPVAGCTYFSATQHNLCGGFKRYWETYGGLAIFGYPITEEFVENGMTVQYFERARFEWQPGKWPEKWDVLLGLLGQHYAELHGQLGNAPFKNSGACGADGVHYAGTSSGYSCVHFPATGHTLRGGFLRYWETYGGLAIFGYPISEEFTEGGFTVQYFERARFEWQPGKWPEKWDVLLGRLGANLLMTDVFTASLTGGQEVPAAQTNAFGVAHVALNYEQTELHYWVNVWDIANVTQAHIHWAPPGANGGVVAWLYPDAPPPALIPGTTNGPLAHGVIAASELVGPLAGKSLHDLLWEIRNGNAYVNVHTQQFPGGEIRGQLNHGGLMAFLTGSQEVPNPVSTDASGEAVFMVTPDGQGLAYRLQVENIQNVLQAHIHRAPFGQNGDVVAWLYPSGPPATLKPGVTNGVLGEGTITGASLVGPMRGEPLSTLLREIVHGMTYVNVHTQQNPGGEIRGQLNMPGFVATLSGAQERPNAVQTSATGRATFALSPDGQSIQYELHVANIENVTMAHIHLGPADGTGDVVAWLYPEGPPPSLKPGTTTGLLMRGTITASELVGPLAGQTLRRLLAEMLVENTYVNVHTQQNPAGEIRGQITDSQAIGQHFSSSGAASGGGEHQH